MTTSASRVRELLDYDPETGFLTWRVRRGGRASAAGMRAGVLAAGYLKVGIDGERYQAHRLIWLHVTGSWPDGQIDHINGVRHDNRWENLRVVTNAQNQQNLLRAKSSNQVGLLGVSRHAGGMYRARIKVNGRMHCLGVHETAQAAHSAYLAAKQRLHVPQPLQKKEAA